LFSVSPLVVLDCEAIACYSCVSINGSDPKCEDPMSASVPLDRPCRQSVAGHEGLFYAYYCSKIKGVRQSDGRSLLIRHCSMDKLADIPTHCGQFSLDEELYSGCIATCTRDWCNTSPMLDHLFLLCFLGNNLKE
uniref:Protein sleepless n=1 Tax=Echinostoma caproni TaxID=27848 RepID=A0A183ATK3_9TREM